MHLVVIAWLYVALMMAVAEATNSTGTVLGAIVTFVLYGLLPVALVVYLMATPARRLRAGDEGRPHLIADLEGVGADAGPEPGHQRRRAALVPEGCDRPFEHAGGQAAPARMRGRHASACRIGEQHRQAVGHQD